MYKEVYIIEADINYEVWARGHTKPLAEGIFSIETAILHAKKFSDNVYLEQQVGFGQDGWKKV